MTAILQRRRFTVAEYHRLAKVGILQPDDRVELLDGEIIEKNPINSPHAGMVNRMVRFINKILKEETIISVQNPIAVNMFSEPEPDIVIAKFRDDDYIDHHPTPEEILLLIEVSDSTLKKDRTIKRDIYAKAGIKEYWIININDKQVEVFREPKNGKYHLQQIISDPKEINADVLDLSISYEDLFA